MYEASNIVVGKALKSARQAAGLSQQALADSLQVPQSMISKIETGERELHVSEVFAYAEALGTTPEYILEQIRHRLKLPEAKR